MLVNIRSVSLQASNPHSFALLLENNCTIKNIGKCVVFLRLQFLTFCIQLVDETCAIRVA